MINVSGSVNDSNNHTTYIDFNMLYLSSSDGISTEKENNVKRFQKNLINISLASTG